jgi:protein translocase SecG subunit
MGFVLGLLSVIAVLSSIVLAFVVLLQEPKGGGIAAALGGSGMEAIGPATGGVNRFTSWTAGVWMVTCFLHAILMTPGTALVPKDDAKKGADTSGSQSGEKPADNGGGGGGENAPPK